MYSPKLLSTVPSNTDNSTNIISSAWVNTFWNYVRTQAYSWSGIQTFNSGIKTNLISYPGPLTMGSVTNLVNIYSPTLASDVPVDTDDSSNIPSTAWVNNFWTYVRTQAYNWSAIQTFDSGIIATTLKWGY